MRLSIVLLWIAVLTLGWWTACGGLEYEDVDSSARPGGVGGDDDDATDDDDDDQTDDDDNDNNDDNDNDDDTGDDDDDDSVFDPQDLIVQAYDVDLGDALLLEIPGPYAVLIDGGATGSGFYTICPDLTARGVQRLDVVVLTHPHYDHAGGLAEVLQCIEVGEVWYNGQTSDDEGVKPFFDQLEDWGGTATVKAEGDVDQLGDVTIRTLHGDNGYEDVDDNSLVQMVEYGDYRFLTTGDADVLAQQELADDYGADLTCDVLKIPDHGLPNAADFITDQGAPIGLLSVGPNEMGYPNDETLNAYLATGMTIYRTDVSGNLRVTFGDAGVEVETQN